MSIEQERSRELWFWSPGELARCGKVWIACPFAAFVTDKETFAAASTAFVIFRHEDPIPDKASGPKYVLVLAVHQRHLRRRNLLGVSVLNQLTLPFPQAHAFSWACFHPSCFRSSSRSTWRIVLTSRPYPAHAMRCTP